MRCNTKIETIKQYKCLQHMESWGLSATKVDVELIADNAVKVTDCDGETMVIEMTPEGRFLEDGIPAEIAHA